MKISSNHADFKYDKILISLLQDVETKYWFDWIKGFNSTVNNTGTGVCWGSHLILIKQTLVFNLKARQADFLQV